MPRRRRSIREQREVARRVSQDDFKGTASERIIRREFNEDGWRILNRGWPDFLAVRDGEARLIEVKAGSDQVTEHQRDMFDLLEKHFAIKVEVVYLAAKPRP